MVKLKFFKLTLSSYSMSRVRIILNKTLDQYLKSFKLSTIYKDL